MECAEEVASTLHDPSTVTTTLDAAAAQHDDKEAAEEHVIEEPSCESDALASTVVQPMAHDELRVADGVYVGEVNPQRERHGQGKYTSNDRRITYTGAWLHDRKNGFGTLEMPHKELYEGEFKDDLMHGRGKLVTAAGRTYEGEFRYGEQTGQASVTHSNGDKSEGNFVEGRRQGRCSCNFANGDTFDGNWIQDRLVDGTYRYKDGRVYDGQWGAQKKRAGCGKLSFPNGEVYDGEWFEGRKHGEGTYTYPDGRSYVGQWVQDKKHGRGVFTYSNGDTYDGDWANDTKAGGTRRLSMKNNASFNGSKSSESLPVPIPHDTASRTSTGSLPPAPSTLLGTPPPMSSSPPKSPMSYSYDANHNCLIPRRSSTLSDSPVQHQNSGTPDKLTSPITVSPKIPPLAATVPASVLEVTSSNPVPRLKQELSGVLEKYAIGRKFLSFGNWNERFFTLNANGLAYYKDATLQKLCGIIDVECAGCRLVTRPSVKTHKKASDATREFVVVFHESGKEMRLLMRAAHAADHDKWCRGLAAYIRVVDDLQDL